MCSAILALSGVVLNFNSVLFNSPFTTVTAAISGVPRLPALFGQLATNSHSPLRFDNFSRMTNRTQESTIFMITVFRKLINFNWRLITLQYCSSILPYIDMNQPWVYMCPSTPLPPPSPSHPSGSSQCAGSECPVSCIKFGLVIISYMVIYLFQCYSLKSSHPHLLPQRISVSLLLSLI